MDFKPFPFSKYFKTVLVEVNMNPAIRGGAEKRKNQFQFSKSVSRLRS